MSTTTRWSDDQVLALAPDTASISAGRKSAGDTRWTGEGCSTQAIWGLAPGSGKNPYVVTVDLTGPAYKCSCPSRKFPCKHAIGLLLRWSAGQVQVRELPDFAETWLQSRAASAERAEQRAAKKTPPDPAAQAKRAAAREEKVAGGIAELQRWLGDQIRAGLASLPGKGYGPFETLSARLVDAQCPGLAARVRALPAIMTGDRDWPQRMLEELSLLQLLATSYQRLPEIATADPRLAETIRLHVGFPVSKESVLASAPERALWTCVGSSVSLRDNLTQRTNYLVGADPTEVAVVIDFAPGTTAPEPVLAMGSAVEADLHYYPGYSMRAILGARHSELQSPGPISVVTCTGALEMVAAVLSVDPWAGGCPVWVGGLPRAGGPTGWLLVDEQGEALPVRGAPWHLLAVSGGHPISVLLDWSPTGWKPISALSYENELVGLG